MEIGDTKPAPWEPKSHRMLKMICTDGQQDIIAMEYESLPCLKEPFIPGFKVCFNEIYRYSVDIQKILIVSDCCCWAS